MMTPEQIVERMKEVARAAAEDAEVRNVEGFVGAFLEMEVNEYLYDARRLIKTARECAAVSAQKGE